MKPEIMLLPHVNSNPVIFIVKQLRIQPVLPLIVNNPNLKEIHKAMKNHS